MVSVLSYGSIIVVILLGVLESIHRARKDKSILDTINKVLYYFSIFITLILLINNVGSVFKLTQYITDRYYYLAEVYLKVIRVISVMLIFFIIQISIYGLLKLLSIPLKINREFKNKSLLYFLSIIFGAVKSLLIVYVLFIALIIYNSTIAREFKISVFDDLKSYNEIEESIINKRKYIGAEEEYIDTGSNIIIFYNGVTLEEGIESCDEIDNMAVNLTKDLDSDRDKAKVIYTWIGKNIEYDFNKAEKALNNEKLNGSGAISAWKNKSGICFDYACLYVAMATKSDLKVRLVTGKAFDGITYGPHAWNEVFLEDENIWVNVDSTFYAAGSYFDSEIFGDDHIKENIAGEW